MREGRWRKIEALPDIFTEALAQAGSLPASAVFIAALVRKGRHELRRLIGQHDILQGGKVFLRLSWGSRSRGAAHVQLGGGSKTDRRVE